MTDPVNSAYVADVIPAPIEPVEPVSGHVYDPLLMSDTAFVVSSSAFNGLHGCWIRRDATSQDWLGTLLDSERFSAPQSEPLTLGTSAYTTGLVAVPPGFIAREQWLNSEYQAYVLFYYPKASHGEPGGESPGKPVENGNPLDVPEGPGTLQEDETDPQEPRAEPATEDESPKYHGPQQDDLVRSELAAQHQEPMVEANYFDKPENNANWFELNDDLRIASHANGTPRSLERAHYTVPDITREELMNKGYLKDNRLFVRNDSTIKPIIVGPISILQKQYDQAHNDFRANGGDWDAFIKLQNQLTGPDRARQQHGLVGLQSGHAKFVGQATAFMPNTNVRVTAAQIIGTEAQTIGGELGFFEWIRGWIWRRRRHPSAAMCRIKALSEKERP